MTVPDGRPLAHPVGAEREEADLPALVREWATHDPGTWGADGAAYERLARRFLRAGEPLLAFEVVEEGLDRVPGDPTLRHLKGLALARAGATDAAAAIARELEEEIRSTPDAFGDALREDVHALVGRTYKDRAARAGGEGERDRHLRRALAAYADGARGGGFYSAINAAAVALLLGEVAEARGWAVLAADRVAAAMADRREGGGEVDHWALATLGEAALILGDEEEARRRYAQAAAGAARDLADVATMRRQARLLAGTLRLPAGWIEEVLAVPPVVIFAGGPAAQGDLARLGEAVSERLHAGVAGGWVAGLSPAEIVFLEVVRARGASTGVVLPCPPALLPPPAGAGAEEWTARRSAAASAAAEVVVASASAPPIGAPVREYTELLALGLARLQARSLDTELLVLAGAPGAGGAEADERAGRWREAGCSVERLPHLTAAPA